MATVDREMGTSWRSDSAMRCNGGESREMPNWRKWLQEPVALQCTALVTQCNHVGVALLPLGGRAVLLVESRERSRLVQRTGPIRSISF